MAKAGKEITVTLIKASRFGLKELEFLPVRLRSFLEVCIIICLYTIQPTDGDLCPAGWKLPYEGSGASGSNIGGTKGGFSFLDKQMGGTDSNQSTSVASNKWRTFPNNFIYSGRWNDGSASARGNYGLYWSASANNVRNVYTLYFYSTYVSPGINSYTKFNGYPVRCVSGL